MSQKEIQLEKEEIELIESLEIMIKQTKAGNVRSLLMVFLVGNHADDQSPATLCFSRTIDEAKILSFNTITLLDVFRKDILAATSERNTRKTSKTMAEVH